MGGTGPPLQTIRYPVSSVLVIKRYKHRHDINTQKIPCRGRPARPLLLISPELQTGLYNFSSAQVRSRSFRCERLHLPDLTWRQRSHSRSYATNCPNFNLDAIVCEPSYEIKDFGLGHEPANPYKIIHPTPKKAIKKDGLGPSSLVCTIWK